MTSRRVLKAAEAIREVVSMTILTELRDPRISDVTVTAVEVSADMRQAKVHVSIMGDETKQNLALRGLQNASGFLQSKIAKRIDTRYTPRLRFQLDHGVKHSIEVSRILNEVLPRPTTSDVIEDDLELDSEPGDEEEMIDSTEEMVERPGENERGENDADENDADEEDRDAS
jgi:ribosome-binding factor A